MEQLARIGFFALAALNNQQVLLCGYFDFRRAEPGHGQRDAIIVGSATFDGEGRIVVAGVAPNLAFEQVEQAVKADSGAAIGSEIETWHFANPLSEQFVAMWGPAFAAPRLLSSTPIAARGNIYQI